MAGIDRHTGKPIERPDHIKQSIEVLLTTPKGTRVMQEELGVDYLDRDGNIKSNLSIKIIKVDVQQALSAYEPRIHIGSITPHFSAETLSAITVDYTDIEDNNSDSVTVSF